MTIQTIPPTFYQVAFNADPNQNAVPPWWTDISGRVQFGWSTSRGRHYELDVNETGMWRPTLANPDGALDPSNTASPYAPGVVPYRQARIRCLPGPNLLTSDQATGGEGSGYGPGTVPGQTNVTCGAGFPLTYAASGSAYQGTQVYQVAVPNGAAQPQNLLNFARVPALPSTVYSAQIQARALATVQNLAVSVSIDWFNSAAALISTTTSSGATLTGGSTTWVNLPASGKAPVGTAYCQLRAVLGTTTTATATFQADGVQFEANPFTTLFQVPNTLSANLFPRSIATGGLSTGTAAGVWNPDAGTVAYATGLTAAPPGQTSAVGWTTPIGTTTVPNLWAGPEAGGNGGHGQPSADNVQVVAGAQYTASVYVLRAASADVTLAVQSSISFYTASGTYISQPVGTPVTLSTTVWGRLSVTATAPAAAAWGRLILWISTPGTTTAANTVYVTGGQFEHAGVASTWQDPGTAYSVITSFIERWPQGWNQLNGTYGTSDVDGVDAFAALSQYTLPAPFAAEVLALNPNFFYQLNDPVNATACTDSAGKRPAAPVENSPFGAGSVIFGNPVTATTVPSGGFSGTTGPVATFNNNPSNVAPLQFAETFVSLHKTTAVPGPPVSSAWTRIIAFRCSAAPPAGGRYQLWAASTPTFASGTTFLRLIIAPTTGVGGFTYGDNSGGLMIYTTPGSLCDGNWHLFGIGVDPSTGNATMWLDGQSVATQTGMAGAGGVTTDVLGANAVAGGNTFTAGLVGDLAHAAEFPTFLSNAQMTNLYNSWRLASPGESSGARANRVLKWIGWTGPVAVDAGSTVSMGPATDLTGATALDALNNIALTENGTVFVSNSGVLTFKARGARYGQAVPTYTFGEQAAAGEWPFEYLHFENDPSHIASDVQIVQYTGPTTTAFDTASRRKTFPRVYQRTINASSLSECADAANYLLSVMKVARQRVDVLRLHPSAVPGLFQVCLSLDLGTRIRVNRRSVGIPSIVFDGFVEKIEWLWQADANDVFVTLQCSPALKYWTMAALHTTLSAQANSGTNTITINALPDAAVNVLASSLPSGYQLTLDPGTAIAETVTIAPGGIPSTSPGYISAVLTLSANLAFTHASGAVVCEPLPAGVTDPTAFDSQSVLGAASTTFAAAATAGTSLITINALPDAKANALASSVPQSWTVWLSPGTANFEVASVAPLGLPVTYPGYTTAVLTLASPLANNHTAGDIVCDPLPGGFTNPAQILASTIPAY